MNSTCQTRTFYKLYKLHLLRSSIQRLFWVWYWRPFKIECVFCIRKFRKLNQRARKHNTNARKLHAHWWLQKIWFCWNCKCAICLSTLNTVNLHVLPVVYSRNTFKISKWLFCISSFHFKSLEKYSSVLELKEISLLICKKCVFFQYLDKELDARADAKHTINFKRPNGVFYTWCLHI